ncbi:MAG: hypothetical protein M1829_002228 [Trizodia sp. TS-e1964]|nr:MAG: hypothetical protein M1829_002228 [Trizodia sp. TS-e1964]
MCLAYLNPSFYLLILTLLALFSPAISGIEIPAPRLKFAEIYCQGPIKAVDKSGYTIGFASDSGGFSMIGGRNRGLFIVGRLEKRENGIICLLLQFLRARLSQLVLRAAELVIENVSLENSELDEPHLCNMLDETPRRLSCLIVNPENSSMLVSAHCAVEMAGETWANPSTQKLITSDELVVNNKRVPHLQDLGSKLETFSKVSYGNFNTRILADSKGEFFLTCSLTKDYRIKRVWD